MALGPGKYDDVLLAARKMAGATGGVLLLVGGDDGQGFSVQMDGPMMLRLPMLLRFMADQIEADLRRPDFMSSLQEEEPRVDRGNREQRRAARRRAAGGRD